MKQVALSSGFPFSSLFPNVRLKNRSEGSVQDQMDSGYPRFGGDPDVLIAYASAGIMEFTSAAALISHGVDNEASRVLQFSNIIQFAGHIAENFKDSKVAFVDATTLDTATVSVAEDDSPGGSTESTPEKAQALSSTPRGDHRRSAEGVAARDDVSVADSKLDAGILILQEFVYGEVFRQISSGSRTELVVGKNDEKSNPYYQGSMELSQNLLDKANFKKKKEQVPSTAVLLNMHNFDRGIFNRKTYVASCDGSLGFACCFIPDMKGVDWRAGKMTGRDIKGEIVYSQCFNFLDHVNRTHDVPFEATKSTLYGMECLAMLCSPELEAIASVDVFWEQVLNSKVALAKLGAQVLEPMYMKPLHYERPTFRNTGSLPIDLTPRYEDGRLAHARATAHLRALAEHYHQLSDRLLAEVTAREKEVAENEPAAPQLPENLQHVLLRLSEEYTVEQLQEIVRQSKKPKLG